MSFWSKIRETISGEERKPQMQEKESIKTDQNHHDDPANYSEEKKYPVLYVLHGIFGDEYSMCGDGKQEFQQ